MAVLKIDVDGIEEAIERFKKSPKIHAKAMARTMNDAGRAASTAASKNVRGTWNLKAGYRNKLGNGSVGLKDLVRIKRANMRNLSYTYRLDSRSVPLTYFNARKINYGVSYKLKKTGARGKVKSGFIIHSKRRNRDYAVVRKSPKPQPLRILASITPTTMFVNTKSDDVWFKSFVAAFRKNYIRNVRYYSK